jgi:endogenous inhibitor of DNA gyrase (YacG/DUF329 family)
MQHIRTVIDNTWMQYTVYAVQLTISTSYGCARCGTPGAMAERRLYRFYFRDHTDPDHKATKWLADGHLFCSRRCAEIYIGQSFDERKAHIPLGRRWRRQFEKRQREERKKDPMFRQAYALFRELLHASGYDLPDL